MARPKKTTTLIQDALNDKDIEALYWAFLQHCVMEIRTDGKLETFSGNHVIAMLDQLSKLQEKRENGQGLDRETEEELKIWLAAK